MRILLPLAFIVLGIIFRVIPHPANFSPIFAIALFGGTYFTDRRLAVIVPLAALFISDFFIGFYSPMMMVFVYLGLFASSLLGFWLRKHNSALNIAGASLASAVIFFLLSNFGVWLTPFSGYGKSVAGLWQCYVLAIPFFRYTLLSNLVYSAILFGGYELVTLVLKRKFQTSAG